MWHLRFGHSNFSRIEVIVRLGDGDDSADDKLNSSDCKVMYMTRNPKDILVSLPHFVMSARVATENIL